MNAIYYQISHSVYSTPETQRQSYRIGDYLRNNSIEGDVVELGVAAGGNFATMLLGCRDAGIMRKGWGFDSFQGIQLAGKKDTSQPGIGEITHDVEVPDEALKALAPATPAFPEVPFVPEVPLEALEALAPATPAFPFVPEVPDVPEDALAADAPEAPPIPAEPPEPLEPEVPLELLEFDDPAAPTVPLVPVEPLVPDELLN